MGERNHVVDFAKFIASLMIVSIHTGFLRDIHSDIGFWWNDVICRLAVPFFSVCTGFFLGKKIEGTNQFERIIWGSLRKQGILYLKWAALYLFFSIPMWIKINWFSLHSFVDYGFAVTLTGAHYHLWYLLSLIYALPMVYLCLRFVPRRMYPALAAGLWLVKALSYGYSNWMPYWIQLVFGFMEKLPAPRDAVFLVLPLVLLGIWISGYPKKQQWFYRVGFLISFILLSGEAFLLKELGGHPAVSFILFTLPTAFFCFHVVQDLPCPVSVQTAGTLGRISVFVYCIHPMLIESTDTWFQSSFTICIMTA